MTPGRSFRNPLASAMDAHTICPRRNGAGMLVLAPGQNGFGSSPSNHFAGGSDFATLVQSI